MAAILKFCFQHLEICLQTNLKMLLPMVLKPNKPGCFQNWCHLEKQDGRHGHYLEILFPVSNSKTLLPVNLELERVVGHHLGLLSFEIGATSPNKMAAMAAIFEIPFLESISKMLQLINLKLNRVVWHLLG